MPKLSNTKQTTADKAQYTWRLLLRIFIPFALGYFLSYLFRVVNTIIAGDLSADLDISATKLGLLTSAYLITFAAIQLPLGVLLDKYGPRRVEAFLLLFAALGAAIFATATDFNMLVIGRALIGLGVSACLMAAFKSFAQWFPAERLPLANGLHMSAGGLGVLFASSPTAWLLETLVWQNLFQILSIATFLVAITIFIVVPDKPIIAKQVRLSQHIGGILNIFTDRYFWRIIPLSVTSQASALALIGLWTGPWFRDIANFNEAQVSEALTLIAVSMIAGFIIIGYVAYVSNKRGFDTLTIAVTGMCIFLLIQTVLIFHPVDFARPIWILFGFFSTSSIPIYAALSQRFSTQLAGRANTAMNFLVFTVGFFVQWGIGVIIDAFPSTITGHYAIQGYQTVFICLVVIQTLSLIWYWFSRR